MRAWIRIVSIAAAVAIPPSGARAGEAIQHTYVSWLYGGQTHIAFLEGEEKGFLSYGDHVGVAAAICPASSEYHCFLSGDLDFAIPKSRTDAKSWELEGIHFEVVDARVSLTLWGQSYSDLLLVRSMRQNPGEEASIPREGYFLYSRQHGLVAFGRSPEAGRSASWLAKPPGFGAAAD